MEEHDLICIKEINKKKVQPFKRNQLEQQPIDQKIMPSKIITENQGRVSERASNFVAIASRSLTNNEYSASEYTLDPSYSVISEVTVEGQPPQTREERVTKYNDKFKNQFDNFMLKRKSSIDPQNNNKDHTNSMDKSKKVQIDLKAKA